MSGLLCLEAISAISNDSSDLKEGIELYYRYRPVYVLIITLARVGGGYSTLFVCLFVCVCVCVCYHKIGV